MMGSVKKRCTGRRTLVWRKVRISGMWSGLDVVNCGGMLSVLSELSMLGDCVLILLTA